jgi:hypothetical protein
MFDWSRCLEESVEHTAAFMGSYVPSRSCGAVPFCRDLLVFMLKVVTSEEQGQRSQKRNFIYQTNDTTEGGNLAWFEGCKTMAAIQCASKEAVTRSIPMPPERTFSPQTRQNAFSNGSNRGAALANNRDSLRPGKGFSLDSAPDITSSISICSFSPIRETAPLVKSSQDCNGIFETYDIHETPNPTQLIGKTRVKPSALDASMLADYSA